MTKQLFTRTILGLEDLENRLVLSTCVVPQPPQFDGEVIHQTFAEDFSNVEIHCDSEGTCGDINSPAFSSGEYNPDQNCQPDLEIVAHEIAHQAQLGNSSQPQNQGNPYFLPIGGDITGEAEPKQQEEQIEIDSICWDVQNPPKNNNNGANADSENSDTNEDQEEATGDEQEEETKDEGHDNWIEILSVNPRTDNQEEEKEETKEDNSLNDLVFIQEMNRATPKLMQTSDSEKDNNIQIRRDRETGQEYLRYQITEPVITSYSPNRENQSGNDGDKEEITINYKRITIEYKESEAP